MKAKTIVVGIVGALIVHPIAAKDAAPKHESSLLKRVSEGWRATEVLNKRVTAKDGHNLGEIRNLILDGDGQLAAFLVESPNADTPEYIFRLPWRAVHPEQFPAKIIADVSNSRLPSLGVFLPTLPTWEEEYRVTQVIGDYARVQPGYAFGYVTDVVFDRSGSTVAVLVNRDWVAGGGTYAFPFTGSGKWSPQLSYFGLPQITLEQAKRDAVRIDANEINEINADRDTAGDSASGNKKSEK